MVAREQGHCGWTTVTSVGSPAIRGIRLPEGHLFSVVALLPGVFSYSRTIRNPAPIAKSQTTTPKSNNQVDRLLNFVLYEPAVERILELASNMI
jgi:hypothetical protein